MPLRSSFWRCIDNGRQIGHTVRALTSGAETREAMDEKRDGAAAPTVGSVTTGAPDAPTLVVGPSDGAGGVALPSGDTPWGPMGALGDRLYAPELLRKVLSAAVDVWRTVSCGNHSAPLDPLLNSVPDRMTEACEKLWRATAGRVTP